MMQQPEAGDTVLAQPSSQPQGHQPPQNYPDGPPPPFMMMMPEMSKSQTQVQWNPRGKSPMGPPQGQQPLQGYPPIFYPHPFTMMMPEMPKSQTQVQCNPRGESPMGPPQGQQPLQGYPRIFYPHPFTMPDPRGESFMTRTPEMQMLPEMQMVLSSPIPLVGDWKECEARFSERQKRRMESFSGMDPLDYDERRKRRMERFRKYGACFGRDNLHRPDGSFISDVEIFSMVHNGLRHKHAKIALEFYEKSQDSAFEMVEALYSDQALLVVPGASAEHSTFGNHQEWCHVSFIAKPKNTDCNDASPKYFFAELLKAKRSTTFNVKYCSTFEPSDDAGFKHGCVFCPADQKFHPGVDGYRIGGPPCSVVRRLFV